MLEYNLCISIMFYEYCIFYYGHVSEKSTGNKRKKATKEIDDVEDGHLIGNEAGDPIIIFSCVLQSNRIILMYK